MEHEGEMMGTEVSRRGVLGAAAAITAGVGSTYGLATSVAAATGLSGNVSDGIAGMATYFPLGSVKLLDSDFKSNQSRNSNYIKYLDPERMLYNFRQNVGISTTALAPGGWEQPACPLRGHSIGHWLSALALTHANTLDPTCKTKGDYIVSQLAICQNLALDRGYHFGYLSAFPEIWFDELEDGLPTSAPYYVLHRIMQGLLDQYELAGNLQAKTVLVRLADWVDNRTSLLLRSDMQVMLDIEFGGMAEVMCNVGTITGDNKYFVAADRWWHDRINDSLVDNDDELEGEHANRQIATIVGLLRLWEHNQDANYFAAANNFWNIVQSHHTYAYGGNSDGEHFFESDSIATRLNDETSENCNSYNMLRIARLLFAHAPARIDILDYYERTLFNQMLGEQQPNSYFNHYFLGTKPGSIKQEYQRDFYVDRATNGDYSSDYKNFTCDHGSGMETQAKFADTIYSRDGSSLSVNLYIASEVSWSEKNLVLRQSTSFPDQNTTTIEVVSGSATAKIRIRIPGWVAAPVSVLLNGVTYTGTIPAAGNWLEIDRNWTVGNTVKVTFPMSIRTIAANDIAHVKALAYGPIVLAGQYPGATSLPIPRIDLASVQKSLTGLQFTASANGQIVTLKPLARTHGIPYNVYWLTAPAPASLRAWYRFDETAGAIVGDSSGQAMHASLQSGGTFGAGKVGRALTLAGSGAHVRLPAGITDNVQAFTISVWVRIDVNEFWQRVFDFGAGGNRCMYLTTRTGTEKLGFYYLATVENKVVSWNLESATLSTGAWHHLVVTSGGGAATLYVDGSAVKSNPLFDRTPALIGSSPNSNYIGKSQYADPTFRGAIDDFRFYTTALSAADVTQLHAASFGAITDLKLFAKHSNKVLGIAGMGTSDGSSALQWSDTGTDDHLWRLLDQGDGWYKIRNKNSGKVLGVAGMSMTSGAQILQWSDTGTPDHLWKLVPAGGGWFTVVNKNSSLVLSVDGNSNLDGASAVQSVDSVSDSKRWKFV